MLTLGKTTSNLHNIRNFDFTVEKYITGIKMNMSVRSLKFTVTDVLKN